MSFPPPRLRVARATLQRRRILVAAVTSQPQPHPRQEGRRGQDEDLFSNPCHCWGGNRRNHTTYSRQTQFSSREFLWRLHNYQLRSLWVDSRPHMLHDDDDDDDDGDGEEEEQGYSSFSSLFFREGGGLHDVDDGSVKLAHLTPCHVEQLDRALDALFRMHTPPPTNTYLFLLQACSKWKALSQVKRVHAHLTLHRVSLTSFLGDYLVMTLAKCGAVDEAREISSTVPHRTVFSWTAMISAYVECGCAEEAIKIHQCMQMDGMEPDSYTFVSLFKACGSIPDLKHGKQLHAYACKKGLTSVIFVGNTLVSMYGKCGAVLEAEYIFCALSQRNIVSWTTMLSTYVEQGQGEKALQLYRQMQDEGLSPDQYALVFALQACGILAEKKQALVEKGQQLVMTSLEIVQALHTDACMKGYLCNVFVGTAVVSVYGKCRTILEAENVFSTLTQRNIVTWNAMLSAYIEQGQGEKALLLYIQMQEEGVKPEQLTFVIALQACGTLAEKEEASLVEGKLTKVMSLEILQALQADPSTNEFTSSVFVATTLLSIYAKCGAIVDAEDVFGAVPHRDVVTWNAMLTAYVEQGQGEKALLLYRQMQEQHVTLDDVTLICVLLACSETGSLEMCKQLHFEIVSTKYDPILPVAATLIYAYGNSARMIDSQVFFGNLSEPDIASWNACIAGHAGEGNSAATFCMFENLKLAGMKADEVAFTSVLSACTHTGLVAQGLEYFESMSRDYGITPDLQHYSIMIDLLARSGDFNRIENMLGRMQVQDNLTIWLFLLGACRTHGNIELAKQAFGHAVTLQPRQATAYVLMSNIYADAGLQECAAEVEKARLKEGAWRNSSQSWIEHGQDMHSITVGDHRHPQRKHLYHLLQQML